MIDLSLSLSLSPSVTVSQSGRIQCHPSCHTILPSDCCRATHTFAARRAFEAASPLPERHFLSSRFPQKNFLRYPSCALGVRSIRWTSGKRHDPVTTRHGRKNAAQYFYAASRHQGGSGTIGAGSTFDRPLVVAGCRCRCRCGVHVCAYCRQGVLG